jgi:hypothetical protein
MCEAQCRPAPSRRSLCPEHVFHPVRAMPLDSLGIKPEGHSFRFRSPPFPYFLQLSLNLEFVRLNLPDRRIDSPITALIAVAHIPENQMRIFWQLADLVVARSSAAAWSG